MAQGKAALLSLPSLVTVLLCILINLALGTNSALLHTLKQVVGATEGFLQCLFFVL